MTSDLAADAPTTATSNQLSKVHPAHLTRCEPAERAKAKGKGRAKRRGGDGDGLPQVARALI